MTEKEKAILEQCLKIIASLVPEARYAYDESIKKLLHYMLSAEHFKNLFSMICYHDDWFSLKPPFLIWALGFDGTCDEEWHQHVRTYMLLAYINTDPGIWGIVEYDDLEEAIYFCVGQTTPSLKSHLQTKISLQPQLQTVNQAINQALFDNTRLAWDPNQFSDPRATNTLRQNYKFIITGLRPVVAIVDNPLEINWLRKHRTKHITNKLGSYHYNITEFYLKDPKALCSEVLSCSLISKQKNKTYQNMAFGFVLHMPKHNIVDAQQKDLVAAMLQQKARGQNLEKDSYKRRLQVLDFLQGLGGKIRSTISSPDAILQNTQPHGHNEVLAIGTFREQICARAIFIKITSSGKIWQALFDETAGNLSNLIAGAAKLRRIPVIPIVDDHDPGSDMSWIQWNRRYLLGIADPLPYLKVPQDMNKQLICSNLSNQFSLQFRGESLNPRQVYVRLADLVNVSTNGDWSTLKKMYRKFLLKNHEDKVKNKEKNENASDAIDLFDFLQKLKNGSLSPSGHQKMIGQ